MDTMKNFEIVEFLKETYWSKDYLVEKDGRRKVAKFIKEGLINNPEEVVLRAELARNIYGLLLPESFVFENVPIFIYSIDKVNYLSNINWENEEVNSVIISSLFTIVKSILHVPKLTVPVIGLDDIVEFNGEYLIILPFIQNYAFLREYLKTTGNSGKESVFIAPETLEIGQSTDSSTLYVFGKIFGALSKDETVLNIANQMSREVPRERKLTEEIPYSKVLRNKKTLAIKKITRKEEENIKEFIKSEDELFNFLGVIGTQRIGKTTIIENLENFAREDGIPFLHAVSGSDIIIQTLQLVSDKISEELLNEMTNCIDKVCKIDTVSLAVVQALSTLNRVVIFVDDYHEVKEALRALLRKISSVSKSSNIKIVAFSVENFEDFHKRILIEPFKKHETKILLKESFGEIENIDAFSQWLTNVSNGLPGLIVEYLRYLYEKDVLVFHKDKVKIDIDALENVDAIDLFEEKLMHFDEKSGELYVAVLGQKFSTAELKILEDELGKSIDINYMISTGIIYKEYDKYRFTLKHYWEMLYNRVPTETREKLHEKLSKKLSDAFKKAWHLEMMGRNTSAAVVYLRYIKELLDYYSSPSLVKAIIEKVKKIVGNRILYILIKYEEELYVRTEDFKSLEELHIPDSRLFAYLLARKHYYLFKDKDAITILEKYPENYTNLQTVGQIRRRLLYLRAEHEVSKRRKDYVNRVLVLISELNEANPVHADIITDAYIFISRVLSDSPHRSVQYLKKAEKLSLDFNFAHKLPTIYNNLATETSNTNIAMAFFQKAVDVANNIGLPARGYMARLNMLYHALYSGKINEFVTGIAKIRQRIEMLGLIQEVEFSHTLEAYYHAYNFELEEALEHISLAENIKNEVLNAERTILFLITLKFEEFSEMLSKTDLSNIDDDTKRIFEMLQQVNEENFALEWEKYINSGGRALREEICAVLGGKLARLNPEAFRHELEYLENKFMLDGSLLSLAMVYEGYGHYYKQFGKMYKANVYYSKAITLYKDMGMENRAVVLSQLYNVKVVQIDEKSLEDTRNLSVEILTSLKVIDPKTDPQLLLDYFVSKVLTIFPVKNVYFKIHDFVLEKVYESGMGEFKSFAKDYISLSPLEIYLTDNFDEHSQYEIYASNPNVLLAADSMQGIVTKLGIVEYGFIAVFKGVLTRLRSFIDPLTKLFTRYYFSDALSQYFENAVNQRDSISIVMCDIDNFKKINDTFGHLTGDNVLKKIANILRNNVRVTDIVGRFGGEEFIMAFPSTDVDEVISILERLRRLIKEIDEFPFKITLSFGVVNYPQNTENLIIQSPEDLIRLADTALYHAKNTGKDRIVVYMEGMTGGLHA
ncbi:MAG: diguanylate cyclase [Fervidobacterium sp.]